MENNPAPGRLPAWLKRPAGGGKQFQDVIAILRDLRLETVCDGAACPNRGECFSRGTATFMIMGAVCTRNCRFCAVGHGGVAPLAEDEPERLAQAVRQMRLRHAVITSVTRDDLPDGGAAFFAACIRAVRRAAPGVRIEVLTPDFQGQTASLDAVFAAQPDIFNHNVETVRRLTPLIRSQADYERSLGVLAYMARQSGPVVKSGLMLGLGETGPEISQSLRDLRGAGVQMVTVGQYLRPGKENHPVAKYYTPDEFAAIGRQARAMGFTHVAAGPFVRSSYHAEEGFILGETSQPPDAAGKMPASLRLIIDPPLPGAENMARDEAILEAVNAGQAPPALRFYQWREPTISLGYFQKFEEMAGQQEPVRRLPVVRRQTGGGAILHHDELTYALVLPLDGTVPGTDILDLYRVVHDAFVAILANWGIQAKYRGGHEAGNSQRGPFFCFARRHPLDLMVGGDKLVGSAQRRMKNAVLQHGSFILGRHFPQQPSAAAGELNPQFDLNQFTQQLAAEIAQTIKLTPITCSPTLPEQSRQAELVRKYAGADWTRQS